MKRNFFIIAGVFLSGALLIHHANASAFQPFTRDLKLRSSGPDVKELQQYLNEKNFQIAAHGPGAPGYETTHFGPGTKAALIAFQNAHASAILTPLGLTQGTGNFFITTRNFINGLLNHAPSSTTSALSEPTTTNALAISPSSSNQRTYTISGSATGISDTIVIENNHADFITIHPGERAFFTFPTALADGQSYEITLKQTPTGEHCSASAEQTQVDVTGVIHGNNVTDIHIRCGQANSLLFENTGGNNPLANRFTLGGSISNLTSSIVLQDNEHDTLTVSSNGAFVFANSLLDHQAYAVSIVTQPTGQTCSISNGSGSVSGGAVTSIDITCLTIPVIHITDLIVNNPLIGSAYPLSSYVSSTSAGDLTYIPHGTSILLVANELVFVSFGTSTIAITQAAYGDYTAATGTMLVVGNAPTTTRPTITNFHDITKTDGDAPFDLSASSTSPGTITYSSGNTDIATVSGNTVTIHGIGIAFLALHQAASGVYSGITTGITLTVNAAAPIITFPDISVTYDGTSSVVISDSDITSTSDGAYIFSSSNPDVATVTDGIVSFYGSGTSTLTVDQAASGIYASGTASAELTISSTCLASSLCDGPGEYPASTSTCAYSVGGTVSCGACLYDMTGGQCNIAQDMCATFPCGTPPQAICTRISTLPGIDPPLNSYSCSCEAGYYGDHCQFVDARPTPDMMFTSITKYLGDSSFSFAVTSTGEGSFTFSSSNTSTASIIGGMCTVVGTGTTTITANQTASRLSAYTNGVTSTLMTVYRNYCTDNPGTCQNDGTCTPDNTSFVCTCAAGYVGNVCQGTPEEAACYTSTTDTDPCSAHGSCSPSGEGGSCSCDPCFMGTTCTIFDVIDCA